MLRNNTGARDREEVQRGGCSLVLHLQSSVPGARSGPSIDLVFLVLADPSGCRGDIDACTVMMPQACIGPVLPDLSGPLSFDGGRNLDPVDTTRLAVSCRGTCKSEAELVASWRP